MEENTFAIIILFVGVIGLMLMLGLKVTSYSKRTYTLADLRAMSDLGFENFVASYYQSVGGYSVTRTAPTRDGGKDIILKKGNDVIYVECKRYAETTSTGVDVMKKFIATVCNDQATKGIFITLSEFTSDAYKAAAQSEKHINCISGALFVRQLNNHLQSQGTFKIISSWN